MAIMTTFCRTASETNGCERILRHGRYPGCCYGEGAFLALLFLRDLELVLTVLPTDGKMVHNALYSAFLDFEDATQHFTALQIPADFILTRNTSDYKESAIPVRTPEDFIGGRVL